MPDQKISLIRAERAYIWKKSVSDHYFLLFWGAFGATYQNVRKKCHNLSRAASLPCCSPWILIWLSQVTFHTLVIGFFMLWRALLPNYLKMGAFWSQRQWPVRNLHNNAQHWPCLPGSFWIKLWKITEKHQNIKNAKNCQKIRTGEFCPTFFWGVVPIKWKKTSSLSF